MARDIMRAAKEVTTEGVKRAKVLARDAKPLIEVGLEKLGPALARAKAEGMKRYKLEIRRMLKSFGPTRRKIKTKMRQHEALRAYATDDNIERVAQILYTMLAAYFVQRAFGVVYRVIFRKRIHRAPRHVRSRSVEFRPLSPER
jgi:hypothetical protein